ncbi:hypothetical protein HDU93_005770, partial [Gonapodya sp. JEL0774]
MDVDAIPESFGNMSPSSNAFPPSSNASHTANHATSMGYSRYSPGAGGTKHAQTASAPPNSSHTVSLQTPSGRAAESTGGNANRMGVTRSNPGTGATARTREPATHLSTSANHTTAGRSPRYDPSEYEEPIKLPSQSSTPISVGISGGAYDGHHDTPDRRVNEHH